MLIDIMLLCNRAVSLFREPSINDTLKLFLKPFEYLYKASYLTPQQKAENRQNAIDIGLIGPSTPLDPGATSSPPPKGTYS